MHYREHHAHQVADLSEVPQEVEDFKEEEEGSTGVDGLLDLDHATGVTLIEAADDDGNQVGDQGYHVEAAPQHGTVKREVVDDHLSDVQLNEVDGEDEQQGLSHDHVSHSLVLVVVIIGLL